MRKLRHVRAYPNGCHEIRMRLMGAPMPCGTAHCAACTIDKRVRPEPKGSGLTQSHTQKGSVGSLGTQQSGNRLQHDPRIEREGAVLGVGQIQVDGLIPGEVGTA